MGKQTKKKFKKNKILKGGDLMAAAGALLATGLTGAGLSTGLTDSNTSDSNTSDSNNLGFNNNALTEILGTPIGDLDRITLKKYLIAMQNGMCTKKLEADSKNIVKNIQLPQAIPIGNSSQVYDSTLPMAQPLNPSSLDTTHVEAAKDATQGLTAETEAIRGEESGKNDEVNTILNKLGNGNKTIQQTLQEIQKISRNAKDMHKAFKKAEKVVPTFSDKLKSNFSHLYPDKAEKVKEYNEAREESGMRSTGGKKYSKKNKKYKKTNKKYFKNITNKKRLKNIRKLLKKYKKYKK